MTLPDEEKIVWQGRFITTKTLGKWEYVSRARGMKAAVILAVHENHVLLVEQFRVPLGKPCIELPAGLVGDHEDGEDPLDAAARELEEETGWRAERIELLGEYYSSPGMVSESFFFVRASGLTKVGEGGGVDGENITVHRITLDDLSGFLDLKRAEGCGIDAKILMLLANRWL